MGELDADEKFPTNYKHADGSTAYVFSSTVAKTVHMKADWSQLIRDMKITSDGAYIRHRGGPVVALSGYGFGHRKFEAAAAEELFAFLKKPENGGCTIMLGVPNDWVTWKDDRMRLMEKYAAVISPWNVGRYRDPETARKRFLPAADRRRRP